MVAFLRMEITILESIKVSVIIPVYNTKKYLQECVDSIINQSLNQIEIILVDDGSTDGSVEIVKEYEESYENIIAIYQENQRQGAARNNGLKIARGEYIYFIDSDDVLEINSLEYCYNLAVNDNLDMVVFEANIFGNINGRNRNEYVFRERLKEMPLCINGIEFVNKYYNRISLLNIPFTLFSREFIKKNYILFLENTIYEDVAFYYKVMQCNPKIMIIDKIFYHRRYRNNSTMTSRINEISIFNKINVYNNVFVESTERTKNLYSVIAMHGIRKALQDVIRFNLCMGSEFKNYIIEILNFFSKQVKCISSLLDIQYCYLSVNKLYNIDVSNENIEQLVYNYLQKIKEELKLYNENKRIGIYGSGQDCTAFLDLIRYFFGEFKCQILYIQTEKVIDYKKNLYSVEDIDNLYLDYLLIGSYYYEQEMLEKIIKMTDSQMYKVYSLRKDFHYFEVNY